jgi:hypothetical protein
MDAEHLGRTSLALDAAYCAGAGAILVAAGSPLGRVLGVPASVVRSAGLATGAWAGIVARLAGRPEWRPSVGAVATANVIATGGLAVLGVLTPRKAARTALVAVATEVGAFAVSQVIALRRS